MIGLLETASPRPYIRMAVEATRSNQRASGLVSVVVQTTLSPAETPRWTRVQLTLDIFVLVTCFSDPCKCRAHAAQGIDGIPSKEIHGAPRLGLW